MKNIINVLIAETVDHSLVLQVDESTSFENVVAKEQMLVDSDQYAFVYILEKDGEYTYLTLPEAIWPILKVTLANSFITYVSNNKEKILLPMFNEELAYLIENIKGNSNYGEGMVLKVEETF